MYKKYGNGLIFQELFVLDRKISTSYFKVVKLLFWWAQGEVNKLGGKRLGEYTGCFFSIYLNITLIIVTYSKSQINIFKFSCQLSLSFEGGITCGPCWMLFSIFIASH